MPVINHLLTRRSVIANKLSEPGPNDEEINKILIAAARVPDHKKLVPWRFIIFRGEARAQFGHILATACQEEFENASSDRLETEQSRFTRAPLVIATISRIVDKPGVPEWEQILSAGAACQNAIVAATSLGYAAQWITEWYAYNDTVRKALRLAANERIAGFIYIGTATEPPIERPRPALEDITSEWTP
ncbi:putative NAD(P)H nitroreductase YdjA [bacterium MnTg02]|nr:putative NAD(P)H nitroreductase YdjA [bacterium MnTg02]